jgi:lipopolysaccharide biosynthesis glycosyltransferase
LNILYCFDENYNKQALVSMTSIINNNDCNINFYIIHDKQKTFIEYKELLEKNKKITIQLIQFVNSRGTILPRKKNDHVSDATYFRIFISDFIKRDISNILYLDADVLCIKSIKNDYKEIFKQLEKSDYTVAVNTNARINKKNADFFKKLNIDKSYFNAGVMFINLSKWRKKDFSNKLIAKLEEIKDEIIYWDQDVLNSHINGSYLEIDKSLNCPVSNVSSVGVDEINSEMKLLHYSGSSKPWNISGGIDIKSNYYHEVYLNIFHEYHIKTSYKRIDMYNLISNILNLNIRKLKYPFKYATQAMKTILN